MSIIESVLEMMKSWPPSGQGLFIIIIISSIIGFISWIINRCFQLVETIARGYPPPSPLDLDNDSEE